MIKYLLALTAVGLVAVTPALAQQRPSDGSTFGPGTKLYVSPQAQVQGLVRVTNLGTPVAASAIAIVSSTAMQNNTYTLAGQPDVPRNITVTQTAVGTTDTSGTITVAGTDINGNALTEVITPVAGSTVAGVNAFATVTSITGAGWAENMTTTAGIDTITVGVGNLLGLPFTVTGAPSVVLSGGGPGATGATFSVTVVNGSVTGVTVLTGGQGFVLPPDIIFSTTGKAGSGAAATATVSNGAITSVAVTAGGRLYKGNTGLALAVVGTSLSVVPTTAGTLPTSTVDAHAGTYNGTNPVYVYGDF